MERPYESVLPKSEFYWRLARYGLLAIWLGVFSLVIGLAGYCYFESLSLPEAVRNSSMLLAAIGPVSEP